MPSVAAKTSNLERAPALWDEAGPWLPLCLCSIAISFVAAAQSINLSLNTECLLQPERLVSFQCSYDGWRSNGNMYPVPRGNHCSSSPRGDLGVGVKIAPE